MSVIGAFEAKTRLAQLLKRVEAGERFVITRHSRPVAELVPFRSHDSGKVRTAIEALKRFQRTHSLDGITIRQLIEESRKY
ncbi:MAG: type II toxin-antitoxin system prevent-host-death family antitoxin [Rhodobacteraceae bacterium]|nr:type II toxin-antitoxin system prevent-host-death family antitoxin [Paracoccaceae bacterium]MCY4141387.1 type II toxin-antitoxin system prevent-host-death family antitoxin [Paracoccaceae bacterium]